MRQEEGVLFPLESETDLHLFLIVTEPARLQALGLSGLLQAAELSGPLRAAGHPVRHQAVELSGLLQAAGHPVRHQAVELSGPLRAAGHQVRQGEEGLMVEGRGDKRLIS